MSLQVPELTIEEFLRECLTLGSYLTLYVYLLQCLNSEQTLQNEMKMLLNLSKWVEQVYPRCGTTRFAKMLNMRACFPSVVLFLFLHLLFEMGILKHQD